MPYGNILKEKVKPTFLFKNMYITPLLYHAHTYILESEHETNILLIDFLKQDIYFWIKAWDSAYTALQIENTITEINQLPLSYYQIPPFFQHT